MDIRLDMSFLRRDKVKEGFMRKSSQMMTGGGAVVVGPPRVRFGGLKLVIRDGI